jgi:hypothetical protein
VRAAGAIAVVLAVAGCGAHETICTASATALLTNLVIQVEGEPGARSVVLQCVPGCVESLTGQVLPELTAPVVDGTAGFGVFADLDAVVVTVFGADGGQLTRLATELEWQVVGGSAECGGPMQATVTVPAP